MLQAHLHDSAIPCIDCSLAVDQSNLISLSHPPLPKNFQANSSQSISNIVANEKGKKSTPVAKEVLLLKQSTKPVKEAPQETGRYIDRAKLRRELQGDSPDPAPVPTSSKHRPITPPLPHETITLQQQLVSRPAFITEQSQTRGTHAVARTMANAKSGLGSDRLVGIEEISASVGPGRDWRMQVKESARRRFLNEG